MRVSCKRALRRPLWVLVVVAVAWCGPGARAAESAVESALRPFVASNWLAGAVALVVGTNGVLSCDAVGFADVSDKRPMREDALFWIASMTKPVTAAALMMLADEGKVSLDDPVSKYIPQLDGLWVVDKKDAASMTLKRQARPITLRRLLSEAAVAELSRSQTGLPNQKYGLGFAVDVDGRGAFGHGGAQGTNMTVYPSRGLALVWLVQVLGGYPGRGRDAQGAFAAAGFTLGGAGAPAP